MECSSILKILLAFVLDGLARFNTVPFSYRQIPPILLNRWLLGTFWKRERKGNVSYRATRKFYEIFNKFLFDFALWPTNAQLFHKLSHCYMLRHCRVILSLLSIPCQVTPVFQMQLSVIQFTVKMFHSTSVFSTVTNKCTTISQIITLLHVSTLSCHPQTAYNQYLAKLHKYCKCSCR